MVPTKLGKCANALNEQFRDNLKAEFLKRFEIELKTEFNIFSFALVSQREDGEPMTSEQHHFVAGYSDGYGTAMQFVRDEDFKRFAAIG